MKSYISRLNGLVLVIFLIFELVSLTACSQISTGPSSPLPASNSLLPAGTAAGQGMMSAKIDGQAWTATSITEFAYSSSILSITAKGSNPVITVSFTVLNEGPGTYEIGTKSPGTNAEVTDGSSVWQADAVAGSGTITFTAMTPRGASGTFSLTVVAASGTGATGTKLITDGVFDITPSLAYGRQ